MFNFIEVITLLFCLTSSDGFFMFPVISITVAALVTPPIFILTLPPVVWL